ncbi:hypothetical protein LguiB_009176 [Lonicera macranthoides]
MLGSMINLFDWKLDGGIEPNNLDMAEKFGITLQKAQPLRALPTLEGCPSHFQHDMSSMNSWSDFHLGELVDKMERVRNIDLAITQRMKNGDINTFQVCRPTIYFVMLQTYGTLLSGDLHGQFKGGFMVDYGIGPAGARWTGVSPRQYKIIVGHSSEYLFNLATPR